MTTQKSVFGDVQQIIAEQCDVEPTTIAADTELESLNIDSLERVDLTLQLEKHFGIILEDQHVKRCLTVADVAALVQEAHSIQIGTPPIIQ